MKVSELLAGAVWHTVPKGRMERIAWVEGYLLVCYRGSASIYILGPNVDSRELAKLLKVPYPDNLLGQLKDKHGWQTHKVDAAPTPIDALAAEVAAREEDADIWERYGR